MVVPQAPAALVAKDVTNDVKRLIVERYLWDNGQYDRGDARELQCGRWWWGGVLVRCGALRGIGLHRRLRMHFRTLWFPGCGGWGGTFRRLLDLGMQNYRRGIHARYLLVVSKRCAGDGKPDQRY